MNSCLALAAMHQDDEIVTVEGLPALAGQPVDGLHPLQQAFIDQDAFQCGYCRPGQLCSGIAVLSEIAAGVPSQAGAVVADAPSLTVEEVRERMSGNLCRCGAYTHIVAAVCQAAAEQAGVLEKAA